ncbi:MAG: DUF2232 domain-containing protein [Rhodospirillales bacterium]|nr:DUF2232 domain-containing protein [Rhodospirillales bacterium]
MHKGIALAFGCGLASALMSYAGHSGSGLGVLLANFAMLPLIIVGLAYGTRSTAVASLSGVVAVIAFSNLLAGGIYGVTIAAPAWLVVRYGLMSRAPLSGGLQWYPIGNTLAMLTGYGATVLILAALTNFDAEGGFKGAVSNLLGDFFESRIGGSEAAQSALVSRTVNFFPGVALAGWLLLVTVNAVLAQAFLARRGLQVRPTPNYTRLDAPEWLYWALAAAAVLVLVGGEQVAFVGRNLAIVFAAPFFFTGLGIIHLLMRKSPLPFMALSAFYIFITILGWPMLAVAALGFFEQWAGLRQKYGGLANDTEEEE